MQIGRTGALIAACVIALWGTMPVAAEEPSGTVRIKQVHVALVVSGNVGGGTLNFQGRDYDFKIGGLGYGGVGGSKLEAVGEVYGLTRVEDFQGAYAQIRTGAVAGTDQVGKGKMQLSNAAGVKIYLRSKREGLALALGGDAVFIQFKR